MEADHDDCIDDDDCTDDGGVNDFYAADWNRAGDVLTVQESSLFVFGQSVYAGCYIGFGALLAVLYPVNFLFILGSVLGSQLVAFIIDYCQLLTGAIKSGITAIIEKKPWDIISF